MRSRSQFTVIDLLAVVGIACVVFAILVPFLSRTRELGPHRPRCATNLSNIGKGLAMYNAASRDQWPWLISSNQWSAATGAGQRTAPSGKANYNVSTLLFLLVRDGQSPGIFVCPATDDWPDPNTKTGKGYNWDFSPYADGNTEHVSYSYQAPMNDGHTWSSGVNGWSDSELVILADRTPTYDGFNATFNWAKPGNADPNTGMSQNHSGGYINLLFADIHVGNSKGRADEGIDKDNIYSCAGLKADGTPRATSQGPGTLKLAEHRSAQDSFLLGPKKLEKKPK